MNDKITEIKEALAEVETNGYVGGDVYREDVSYLLQLVETQYKVLEEVHSQVCVGEIFAAETILEIHLSTI